MTNVQSPMVLNPDPRPGRWLLPLVILGMMAFTYVFVQNLPATEGDTQDISADGTEDTTATTTTTVPDESSTTTTMPAPLSPETQAYIDQVAAAETSLLEFQAEMANINSAWDAEPAEIEYSVARDRLADLANRLQTWASDLSAVVPPPALSEIHGTLVATANAAANAANDVLVGFEGPDAAPRIEALEVFDTAVRQFTAVADDIELQATTTGP